MIPPRSAFRSLSWTCPPSSSVSARCPSFSAVSARREHRRSDRAATTQHRAPADPIDADSGADRGDTGAAASGDEGPGDRSGARGLTGLGTAVAQQGIRSNYLYLQVAPPTDSLEGAPVIAESLARGCRAWSPWRNRELPTTWTSRIEWQEAAAHFYKIATIRIPHGRLLIPLSKTGFAKILPSIMACAVRAHATRRNQS